MCAVDPAWYWYLVWSSVTTKTKQKMDTPPGTYRVCRLVRGEKISAGKEVRWEEETTLVFHRTGGDTRRARDVVETGKAQHEIRYQVYSFVQ